MAKSKIGSGIGIGRSVLLWKISIILYLVTNGVLGLSSQKRASDFHIIFSQLFKAGDSLNLFLAIASVISLIAGIALLLDLFKVKLPFFNTLIFIVAMIWVVYVIIEFIFLLKDGFGSGATPWKSFQMLAVHLLVMSSLLITSGKFK